MKIWYWQIIHTSEIIDILHISSKAGKLTFILDTRNCAIHATYRVHEVHVEAVAQF